MTDFLRGLRDLKQENNVFNFDFIAFGKFKPDGALRGDARINFFTKFVQSQFAESFSLYTLELHENSVWYNESIRSIKSSGPSSLSSKFSHLSSDDAIMKDFTLLKDVLTSS
ncbi:MAG: hypothetical protein WCG98_09540 [bacterium]